MIDLLSFDKESVIILEHGLYDQFLEIEERCAADRLIVQRDQMLQSMFSQAIKLDFESIALQIILKFESALLRSAETTVPFLLASLRRRDGLTEIKLSILQMLQSSFLFRHADELVEILEV